MSAWTTMNPLKVITYQDVVDAISSGDLSGTSPVTELHTAVRKDSITTYVSNLDLANTYYVSKIAAEIIVRQDVETTTTTSTTTTTTTIEPTTTTSTTTTTTTLDCTLAGTAVEYYSPPPLP